jgi:hypothetical protein
LSVNLTRMQTVLHYNPPFNLTGIIKTCKAGIIRKEINQHLTRVGAKPKDLGNLLSLTFARNLTSLNLIISKEIYLLRECTISYGVRDNIKE